MTKRQINKVFNESPITSCYNMAPSATDDRKIVQPEIIVERVCNYFSVDPSKIKSKSRKREIVYPRQVAMYLLDRHSKLSLKDIGDLFGGRDHTTVIHSKGTVKDLMDVYEHVDNDVNELIDSL